MYVCMYVCTYVCMFCAVRCVWHYYLLLFVIYQLRGLRFLIFLMFVFYNVYSVVLYCFVSPFVYNCLFPIFVQVYRPLPPGGNPTAVNKYHIISYIIKSYITPFHLILILRVGGALHLLPPPPPSIN
jgi:hypothetical protein